MSFPSELKCCCSIFHGVGTVPFPTPLVSNMDATIMVEHMQRSPLKFPQVNIHCISLQYPSFGAEYIEYIAGIPDPDISRLCQRISPKLWPSCDRITEGRDETLSSVWD